MYSFDSSKKGKRFKRSSRKNRQSSKHTLRKKLFQKKILIPFFGVILVIGFVFYLFIYRPVRKIQAQAYVLKDKGSQIQADFKSNDIDLIQQRLTELETEYDEFERDSSALYWASFIPHIRDFKNGVEAGRYMLQAADTSVKAITPYADLLGLKQGEQSFYEKSAEERLQTAVLTLDKMLENIDEVSGYIQEAESRIEQIDPNRYPKKIGSYTPRETVQQAKDQFSGMASLFVDAKPFLKELPNILGAEEEKTYLLLFQNTAERRATGGFITFWAVFNVNQGKITIKDSSDIYDIDNNISSHPPAPSEILDYHKNVTRLYIRDSNLSPDFPTSIELFDSLYQKAGNRVDYDGIIALDSKVLVDMLKIFGDTQVNGVNFSAEIDERCDCPQVIYTLFDIVDRPVPYLKVDRKRILGNLMLELFYKAIGFSPSKYWGQLAQTMFQNLDEKHILLYYTDENAQKAVEALHYAGRIEEAESDYLHVNNVNFAGAKSNLFIDEELKSETFFEGNTIKRIVTMTFKNPHPHSNCNLEAGGLCLNAQLRNWIRFYVPEGSEIEAFEGSQTETKTYQELGKTVFEGFTTVNPEGKATVRVTYTLPSSISKDDYALFVQKQPGVEKQTLVVEVDGKELHNELLKSDITIEK